METHADVTEGRQRQLFRPRAGGRAAVLRPARLLVAGSGAGLIGGVVLAIPLILWDWVKAGHIALELPAAVTAWLFGLDHFSHQTYRVGPIVLGAAFLCVYWIVSGVAFAGLADRVYRVRTLGQSAAAGLAWSFVSFILFWYMLLPIARDGAPFRATAAAPGLSVAPNWVWILAFTLSGLATGISFAMLRGPGGWEADGTRNGQS